MEPATSATALSPRGNSPGEERQKKSEKRRQSKVTFAEDFAPELGRLDDDDSEQQVARMLNFEGDVYACDEDETPTCSQFGLADDTDEECGSNYSGDDMYAFDTEQIAQIMKETDNKG